MMAELMTVVTSSPRQLRSSAHAAVRAGQAPVDRGPAEDADSRADGRPACAVTIIAYSYSLTTLVQLADLNSPLAYVSLVPVDRPDSRRRQQAIRVNPNPPSTTGRPTTSSASHSWPRHCAPTSSSRASCRPCSGCGGSIS